MKTDLYRASTDGYATAVRRLVLCFAATVCLLAAMTALGLVLVRPVAPPVVEPLRTTHAPLTRHLALVIVDGLRHDIATDATWMPHFAEAMQRHSSAVVLAGEVTMTSSAVLAYGVGKPGGLDQIVYNETAQKTLYDSVPENAARAGLRLAATGDVAWFEMYRGSWNLAEPDPPNVAMDVDYNAEIFAAARRFLAERALPNVLVFHFVTPDHQAHVHGVMSQAYREHIHDFDGKLRALLDSMPRNVTVFVTSDHGATERGNHGSDAPHMRRCPLFAYGPGIVEGLHPSEPIDQLDLASTFAHLLGVPQPAHAEGFIMASWLDVPEPQRTAAACDSLERLERYTSAVLGSSAETQPCPRDLGAVRAAFDRRLGELRPALRASWWGGWLALAALAIAAALIGRAWLAQRPPPWLLAMALALLSLGLAGTRHIENLPGLWPKIVPAGIATLANLGLLATVLRPKHIARWFDARAPVLALGAVGLLVVSYTEYTRAECYVLVAVTTGLVLVRWGPRAWVRALLVVCTVAAIYKLTSGRDHFLFSALEERSVATLAALGAAMALFAGERLSRRPTERNMPTLISVTAVGALALTILRDPGRLPATPALMLWLALPVAAIVLWRHDARTPAEMCGVACFALLSRPQELFFLLATALVADVVSEVAASHIARRADPDEPRHAIVVALVAFAFALAFIQRIGVQSGIDFASIDWSAGSFDSHEVGYLRIGAANISKHVLARGAVLLACLTPLSAPYRAEVARGLVLVELGRALAVLGTLMVGRASFWTALNALSELPHALLGALLASLACALVLGRESRRRGSGELETHLGERLTGRALL